MRAVIIEDELNARNHLKSLLDTHCEGVEIVGEGHDVKTGYEIIHSTQPDLVFLDIRMPDGTGFDLLEMFNSIRFNVIFTTAYSEYAIEAFRFSAIHYLLKPIDPDDLVESVKKAGREAKMKNLENKIEALITNLNSGGKFSRKVVLTTNSNIYVVNSEEIVMCRSDRNYTQFILDDGREIIVAKTIKDYEDLLTEHGFFRAHRQYLINLAHVQSLEKTNGGTIKLTGDISVPVSVRKKDQLIEALSSIS